MAISQFKYLLLDIISIFLISNTVFVIVNGPRANQCTHLKLFLCKSRSEIFEPEGAYLLSVPSRKVVPFILSPVFEIIFIST